MVSLLDYMPGYVAMIASKVEDRIRRFIDEYRPRFVYVMFSAGKDSSAVLAAAMRVAPEKVVAVYNVIAGQTHSINIGTALELAKRFGMRVRRIVPRSRQALRHELVANPPEPPELLVVVVISYRHGLSYWDAVLRYGWPAPAERFGKGIRWCCSEFKEKWWLELPPNGVFQGRPAKFIIVGVKAADSVTRRRRWEKSEVNVFGAGQALDVALAPLHDLTDDDVWHLLKHYGIYDIVHKQYEVFGHSPNCTLCPFMSYDALRKTLRQLPTQYIGRVLRIMEEVRPRYKEGTFSADRLDRWIEMFREELRRRASLRDWPESG